MQSDWRALRGSCSVHREQRGTWWAFYGYCCCNTTWQVQFGEEEEIRLLCLVLATRRNGPVRSDGFFDAACAVGIVRRPVAGGL